MHKLGRLDSLGISHGTDKSSRAHNYLHFYEHFLHRFVDLDFQFVEIGIFNGGSIRMWLEYFPQATIHGLDIDPARVSSIDHPRFVGHVVDHEDLSSITKLIAQISPLVLLDDGSHFWPHQLITLEHLSGLVLDNGLLIVEDLEVCYQPLAATYSCGAKISPADQIAQLSSRVLSGGLDECPSASVSVQMSNRIFSSISVYCHTMVACRNQYYGS